MRACMVVLLMAALGFVEGLEGQTPATGLEIAGVPAINFDSDEGFGYGVLAELYQYGDGSLAPYLWTLQPRVFLTTEGRRDFTVFFDAPHVLPDGWRLDAFLGTERQIATPYYGVGNESVYDESLDAEDGPDPFYYRFGRKRTSGTVTLHRRLGRPSLRGLVGAGLVRTSLTDVPEGEGTTLYAQEVGAPEDAVWSNYLRAGLVWDSRDRETGAQRGVWSEVVVQRVDERLGADASYTRWSVTDRRYFPFSERLVFAHRWLLQGVTDGAPIHDQFRVQSSFRQEEGLGGAKSVRGLFKNRFVGRGMLIWNAELRLRAADFEMLGRPFHLVLSAFVDQGRVWEGDVDLAEVFTDLHRGFGGGLRLGMGQNFTVAFDLGTSSETGLPLYIGLGYLY